MTATLLTLHLSREEGRGGPKVYGGEVAVPTFFLQKLGPARAGCRPQCRWSKSQFISPILLVFFSGLASSVVDGITLLSSVSYDSTIVPTVNVLRALLRVPRKNE